MANEAKESEKQHEDLILPQREQWSHKLDFIFSCIGYAIGKVLIIF